MGFQDRQYNQTGNHRGFGGGGGGFGPNSGMDFLKNNLTPAVKMLLIINVAVFVVQHMLGPALANIIPDGLKVQIFGGQLTDQGWIFPSIPGPNGIEAWFSVIGFEAKYAFQLWRLLTFQFLHADPMHLLFNMLGVFFLGATLEKSWGTKRFITMYLVSGAVGGMLFNLASLVGIFGASYMVGASGGVLALLVACAILFPHIQVILAFFPVPIRFACGLFLGLYILNLITMGPNAGGDLCHLGGMATGFLWVMGKPKFEKIKTEFEYKTSQKKQQEVKNLEFEVDRILSKVHDKGIQSLTKREKEILKKATDMQKKN